MKVNPVRKTFSEVNKAYLAGLIDGDGAIMACIEPHKEKKFRFRVRVCIKISQNDSKVLKWSQKITRFGNIRQNRNLYEWYSYDQKIIRDFLISLLPYFRVKKKQSQLAIKILNSKITSKKDLIKVALIADALSRLNVRSKGRRKNFATMIQESVSPND